MNVESEMGDDLDTGRCIAAVLESCPFFIRGRADGLPMNFFMAVRIICMKEDVTLCHKTTTQQRKRKVRSMQDR